MMGKVGVFGSIVLITHFIMEKRIEEFRSNEINIQKLQKLNHELEMKTRELEQAQEKQEQKLHELEKFNDIAKNREIKMLDLIKKIDKLEKKKVKKK